MINWHAWGQASIWPLQVTWLRLLKFTLLMLHKPQTITLSVDGITSDKRTQIYNPFSTHLFRFHLSWLLRKAWADRVAGFRRPISTASTIIFLNSNQYWPIVYIISGTWDLPITIGTADLLNSNPALDIVAPTTTTTSISAGSESKSSNSSSLSRHLRSPISYTAPEVVSHRWIRVISAWVKAVKLTESRL